MEPTLRSATEADLPAIARLQIAGWQSAYRGLLPDVFLDDQAPKALETRWRTLPQGD